MCRKGRKLLNKLLPLGTRRRLFFSLVFKTVSNPGRFLNNLKGRNIHHFFYLLRKTDPIALEQMVDSRLLISSRQVSNPGFIINLDEIDRLVFNPPSTPLVSIIIPVYNQWQYTYQCLKSILENTEYPYYDIIIAEDNSTDETNTMLKKASGVQVLSNKQNLGFLRNCNNAAQLASGKYILFLNNDIFVTKNWLESLISTAESDEQAAIVGSKIIDKDGKLQECGWIMKSDGWGLPVGRGDNPNKDEYNYVKEVDCISGCCFLVRRDVFEEVGRFDERFAPAYYEEFDLCFGVREKGYKVIIQPKSIVTHYDAASYGYGQRNPLNESHRKIFLEKWRNVLVRNQRTNRIP